MKELDLDTAEGRAALFQSVVENANDVVLVTDAEPIELAQGGPRVRYVNPAFTRMTGYEAGDILGKTPRLLQSPHSDRTTLDRLHRALSAWEPVEVELLNRRKDGTPFWVQINITPVADETGWWTHWVAIQRDITGRKAREADVARMMANTFDLVAICEPDGTCRSVNPAVTRILGYTADEIVGTVLLDLVDADQRTLLVESLERRHGHPAEVRVRHADGSWRWLAISFTGVGDGFAKGTVINGTDITGQRAAEEAARGAEERFRSAFVDGPVPMAVTDPDGLVLELNDALAELLGRSTGDLVGHRLDELNGSRTDRRRPGKRRQEVQLAGPVGSKLTVLHSSAAVAGSSGGVVRIIEHFEDITARKSFESELAHQALHDSLTGLPNRALLSDRLERALQALGPDDELAVLFLNLDRFKVVNESLGHSAGDRVLVLMAERLVLGLRAGDSVARFGADEFVVVCPGAGITDAIAAAQRLCAAVAGPVEVAGAPVVITASVGIAAATGPGDSSERLVRDAGAAMHQAKDSGTSQYEIFESTLHVRALARLELERSLRRAIGTELVLHYQPEVSLTDGELTGVEALVRWNHPTEGLLLPGRFVPQAEEAGLIGDLDSWVLAEACRQIRTWTTTGGCPPIVWVNLSAVDLLAADLLETVTATLQTSGVEAAQVGFEITESALMVDTDRAAGILGELRGLGVRLAIDDFGTGYSALSYLQKFPLDILKIDASFVANLNLRQGRREAFAIIGAVINLAHAIGLSVVAEGVETEAQAVALHGLGCDTAQGYWFARPGPSDAGMRMHFEQLTV